jgi:hypothetical protein
MLFVFDKSNIFIEKPTIMTIADFILWIEQYPNFVILYMVIVPAIAFICSMFIAQPDQKSPLNYIYSVLVYATCVPGILAIVLSGYDFFFQKTDLKQANVLVYFVPIISMVATLVIIQKAVKMAQIPGFKKLSGLMLMIGVSSVLVFILHKMIFVTAFVGSIYTLIGLFILIFIGVKLGWDKMVN